MTDITELSIHADDVTFSNETLISDSGRQQLLFYCCLRFLKCLLIAYFRSLATGDNSQGNAAETSKTRGAVEHIGTANSYCIR